MMDTLYPEKNALPILTSSSNLDFQKLFDSLILKNSSSQSKHRQSYTVHFNQNSVIERVRNKTYFPNLNAALLNYNGLCEIICNYIVIADLLSSKNSSAIHFYMLTHKVTLEKLENDIAALHIIEQTSIFQIVKGALFNDIPYNYLSSKEQSGLNNLSEKLQTDPNKVYELVLKAIDNIGMGRYAKFFVYNKSHLKFEGHSMLIKKYSEDSFVFFDPNKGAEVNINKDKLIEFLLQALQTYYTEYHFDNVCFMDVHQALDHVPKGYLNP